MADIAVPRHSEPADAVLNERVDEGRWESEGGQPVHRMTTEQSPESAISDLAKADTSTPAPSTDTTAAPATTATPATTDSTANTDTPYDAGKVHPKTVEGKAGDASQSHYPEQATSSNELTVESEATAPVARKKSISERLAETWQDIKHKVEGLTHKK